MDHGQPHEGTAGRSKWRTVRPLQATCVHSLTQFIGLSPTLRPRTNVMLFFRYQVLLFSCIHSTMSEKNDVNKEALECDVSPPPPKQSKFGEDIDGKEELHFPNAIEGFGYKFNKDGQLRHIETGQPFEFNVSHNDSYNQKRYEALGEVITNHVYDLLERDAKLKRTFIPIGAAGGDARTFIFVSDDVLSNPDKLIVFIHGSGVVRAGQWARRLIINDCINSGTQLPFIRHAQQEGYAVIVLNTNENVAILNGRKVSIQGSENPEKHTRYVYENFVEKAAAKNIAIVAHSFGGVCAISLVVSHQMSLQQKIFAIALTDSVHNTGHQGVPKTAHGWLLKVTRNWISSKKPLDAPIMNSRPQFDVPTVSAGTSRHEMTSWSSFESIFKFLTERYNSHSSRKGPDAEEL